MALKTDFFKDRNIDITEGTDALDVRFVKNTIAPDTDNPTLAVADVFKLFTLPKGFLIGSIYLVREDNESNSIGRDGGATIGIPNEAGNDLSTTIVSVAEYTANHSDGLSLAPQNSDVDIVLKPAQASTRGKVTVLAELINASEVTG